MITNKKPTPGWHRQAGNICTFNAPDYKQIALKINALLNLLAIYDMAIFTILALAFWEIAK